MMGSVEVIEIHETIGVRTVSRVYDLPTVVRLGRYVKTPIRRVLLNRKNLLLRDNHKCQYCGTGGSNLTIDHIVPKRRGGKDTWENLVAACATCNSKKGNRTPEQAGYQLARKPRRPDRISFIRQSAHSGHKSWRPYLFMD